MGEGEGVYGWEMAGEADGVADNLTSHFQVPATSEQ